MTTLSAGEANRRLLASVEAAKDWRHSDEERWRYASDDERAREVSELLRVSEHILALVGWTQADEPLRFPRLDRLHKQE